MQGGWLMMLAMLTTAVTGSSVVKRSDDSNPLGAVVSRLSFDLQTLQSEMTALQNVLDLFKVKVAFTANVAHEHSDGNHVIVKFDSVKYNEGNAYNPVTGFFTAPVADIYSFFIKTEVNAQHHVGLDIMKEGTRVLYIYGSDSNSFQTPSGQVVLHLARGERVWVQTEAAGLNMVRSWTRFGGFLLHPDV